MPNALAWTYMFSAYCFGFAAILADALWLNALGVLFLAHSMVISAYFIHECAHDSLFKKDRHNQMFGETDLKCCQIYLEFLHDQVK